MDRQGRVLSHQGFSARRHRRLNGVQDCFVLFKRTPCPIAFRGNHDGRWRRETPPIEGGWRHQHKHRLRATATNALWNAAFNSPKRDISSAVGEDDA